MYYISLLLKVAFSFSNLSLFLSSDMLSVVRYSEAFVTLGIVPLVLTIVGGAIFFTVFGWKASVLSILLGETGSNSYIINKM